MTDVTATAATEAAPVIASGPSAPVLRVHKRDMVFDVFNYFILEQKRCTCMLTEPVSTTPACSHIIFLDRYLCGCCVLEEMFRVFSVP